MRPLPLTVVALAALSLAVPSLAAAKPKGCPPGLAKKTPACIPPGLAKKNREPRHDRTDQAEGTAPDSERYYITGDYVLVTDPYRYGLDDNRTYYRFGDNIFRVDKETGEILTFIGSLAALLN